MSKYCPAVAAPFDMEGQAGGEGKNAMKMRCDRNPVINYLSLFKIHRIFTCYLIFCRVRKKFSQEWPEMQKLT